VPFITVAGAGDAVVEELRRAFASTLERRLDDVIDAESLPVWERLFARPEPLFAPTHSTAAVAKP
jgi:hypothetical protein